MASAGELCSVCYAGALQLQQGLLVCEVCGTQSQVRVRLVTSNDHCRADVCTERASTRQPWYRLSLTLQEFVETQEELPEGQAPNTARRIKQKSKRSTKERETIPAASLTGATCTQLVMGYALLWQRMLKVGRWRSVCRRRWHSSRDLAEGLLPSGRHAMLAACNST